MLARGLAIPFPPRYLQVSMVRRPPTDDLFILSPETPLPSWPLVVTEVGASCWPVGRFTQREASPIMALELVLEGRLHLQHAGNTVTIAAGELMVLRRQEGHLYRAEGGLVRKRFLGLAGPAAAHLLGALPDHLVPQDPAACGRVFRRMEVLFRRRGPGWQAQAAGLAYGLLAGLAEEHHGTGRHPALEAALGLLQEDTGGALTVVELARRVGLSQAQLTRLFQAEFRCAPAVFQRRRRIEQARFLLTASTLTCQQIALRLGFMDGEAFRKMFQRAEGVGPATYRARHDPGCVDSSGPRARPGVAGP